MGFLLHPKVQGSIGKDARIADVVTGTGIVLRDLAKTLPNTRRLDGFDISDSQFPAAKELPSNVELHVGDAKAGLPSSFHGQFDVINIRYLVVAMEAED